MTKDMTPLLEFLGTLDDKIACLREKIDQNRNAPSDFSHVYSEHWKDLIQLKQDFLNRTPDLNEHYLGPTSDTIDMDVRKYYYPRKYDFTF